MYFLKGAFRLVFLYVTVLLKVGIFFLNAHKNLYKNQLCVLTSPTKIILTHKNTC